MSSSRKTESGVPGSAHAGARRFGSRSGRVIAGTLVAGLTVAGLAATNSQSAGAATAPAAQSVGRFLDGALGGNPIQQLADVQDARAVAPGTTSVQNPLNATLLGSLNVPLTGALQLPQVLGINLGAANQVAVAKTDGYSYGASGAVANSGGVSVGGDNAAFPAGATINLTAAGLAGNSPIAIPGGDGSAAALGGVQVKIGAVSALAQTPTGVGKPGQASYNIAGLSIVAGSPLLGGLLGSLTTPLTAAINQVISGLTGNSLPASCQLVPSDPLLLDGGFVILDPTNGSLTIDVAKLLDSLNLDLNDLPPNTDLIDLVLDYLTSPDGLAAGVQAVVDGLLSPLETTYNNCKTALAAIPVVGPVVVTLLDTLIGGQTGLENLIGSIVDGLDAVGGTSPLAPLGTVLKKLVDIGVNVQPNGPDGDFTSQLDATPNQATPVVANQTVVRAIELNLVSPLATIALANAAAGPSAGSEVAPTTTTSPPASGTVLPTGVPAGFAKPAGSPDVPLILLAVGLLMASGGAVAWRVRGKHTV